MNIPMISTVLNNLVTRIGIQRWSAFVQTGDAKECRLQGRPSRLFHIAVLLGLCGFTLAWCYRLHFESLFGDDLLRWGYFKKLTGPASYFKPSFLELSLRKYRPITELLLGASYLLTKYRSSGTQALNSLFFLIPTWLFLRLSLRCSKGNYFLAILATIYFVVSHLGFYNIYQVHGIFESACLALLFLMLNELINFIEKNSYRSLSIVLLSFLLIIFTHERFLALLPAILLAILLSPVASMYQRIVLFLLTIYPTLCYYAIIRIVFRDNPLTGSDREPILRNSGHYASFLGKGLATVFGVPMGILWHSGVDFAGAPIWTQACALLSAGTACVLLGRCLTLVLTRRLWTSESKNFIILLVALLGLLFCASVTVRQETRFLFAPLGVFLATVLYCGSQCFSSSYWPRVAVPAILLLSLTAEWHYQGDIKRHLGVYLRQSRSDIFARDTVQKYGASIVDRTLYVKDDMLEPWFFGNGQFFQPYFGLSNNTEIKVVSSYNKVCSGWFGKVKRPLILVFDETSARYVDVTDSCL